MHTIPALFVGPGVEEISICGICIPNFTSGVSADLDVAKVMIRCLDEAIHVISITSKGKTRSRSECDDSIKLFSISFNTLQTPSCDVCKLTMD